MLEKPLERKITLVMMFLQQLGEKNAARTATPTYNLDLEGIYLTSRGLH